MFVLLFCCSIMHLLICKLWTYLQYVHFAEKIKWHENFNFVYYTAQFLKKIVMSVPYTGSLKVFSQSQHSAAYSSCTVCTSICMSICPILVSFSHNFQIIYIASVKFLLPSYGHTIDHTIDRVSHITFASANLKVIAYWRHIKFQWYFQFSLILKHFVYFLRYLTKRK